MTLSFLPGKTKQNHELLELENSAAKKNSKLTVLNVNYTRTMNDTGST